MHLQGTDASREPRPGFFIAAGASAGLCVLFVVVYSWCNWFTSQRADVGTLYFQWERYIPFVPIMIIPYMSIDLFFVGAPFLVSTSRELSAFAKRITAAILIAGACFLLFPLKLAVDRPPASGVLGAIFDWFRAMDKPYNLLPSLHIALRCILVGVYVRHTSGVVRALCHVWFSLIGFSTLLTYQHHIMDIVGGFALGGYCLYFLPEYSAKTPVVRNPRIGSYYAAGAILCLVMTAFLWPWGILLLWPGIAFALVASGYFGAGPGIYRKSDGVVPVSTWWTLAPCLIGQRISLMYYSAQCRAWDAVTPNLWIGRKLSDGEARKAVAAGVTAVLDLSAEFSEAAAFRATRYRNIPVLDLTAPTEAQLLEMATFIEEETRRGVVYVHCKIGYSRSAAAVSAYLLKSGAAASPNDAYALLRKVRPSIVIRPEVIESIEEFSNSAR